MYPRNSQQNPIRPAQNLVDVYDIFSSSSVSLSLFFLHRSLHSFCFIHSSPSLPSVTSPSSPFRSLFLFDIYSFSLLFSSSFSLFCSYYSFSSSFSLSCHFLFLSLPTFSSSLSVSVSFLKLSCCVIFLFSNPCVHISFSLLFFPFLFFPSHTSHLFGHNAFSLLCLPVRNWCLFSVFLFSSCLFLFFLFVLSLSFSPLPSLLPSLSKCHIIVKKTQCDLCSSKGVQCRVSPPTY